MLPNNPQSAIQNPISKVINAITVDVEDYFQVEAFNSWINREDWGQYPCRVEYNTERILQIFDQHQIKGTFFILGWVAERFPQLISRIAALGHEIGSHGHGHQHLSRLTVGTFREDLRKSKLLLEDAGGQAVSCYRAPSFSIVQSTLWALDILVEEGFNCDSSIFPIHHDLYGVYNAPRFPHWRKTPAGFRLFEFPPSTIRILGRNWGIAGGGFLRILPYWWSRWGIQRLNQKEKMPAMVYFHPWELDLEQPHLQSGLRSRLRHYSNLSRMEKKIQILLKQFKFGTFTQTIDQLDSYHFGLKENFVDKRKE
jgi:polysaccharide deacetylase family protein (PEP-CTERM system associated)